MTVGARLWSGLALIVVAVVVLLGVQTRLHRHLNREMAGVHDETFELLEQLRQIESDGLLIVDSSQEVLHLQALSRAQDMTPRIASAVGDAIQLEQRQRVAALRDLRAHRAAYSELVANVFPDEAELARSLLEATHELIRVSDEACLTPDGPVESTRAYVLQASIDAATVRFRYQVDMAVDHEKLELRERVESLRRTMAAVQVAMWAGGALLIVLVLLVLRSIERSTIPQLTELTTVLRQVGEGDLSRRATVHARNELGDLAVALNMSLDQLAQSEHRRAEAVSDLRALNEQLNHLVEARTRELQLAKEQVEVGSRAKSRFLESISHEFRTPLTAVLGYTDLLVMNNGPSEFTSAIAESGRELLALVDTTLSLSEMDHDAIHIDLRAVRLDVVIKEALAEVAQLAHRERVRIERASICKVQVLANDKHLKTALVHLLTNAVLYNRPAGSVRVGCERRDDGLLHVQIEDTGSGFAEEHPGQALEPFERLGRFASTIRGAGVGLTVVESFTRAMGGKLEYSSTPGVGSTFRLALIEAQVRD